MTSPKERKVGRDAGPGFSRTLYPMRIIGTLACIVIASVYVSSFGVVRSWYVFLLVLTLAYPHIFRKLGRRSGSGEKVELGTSQMDAFVLGSTVYVVGFSAIPTLSLMTVAFANGMALGNVSFMFVTALSFLIGVSIPMLFYGVNYTPQEHLLMDMTSALFLLVYFILFARVAYRRAVLLKESRKELSQQKIALEIEKKKSDALLWALLPASVAKDFERSGLTGEPRHYDDVTILAVDAQGLLDGMDQFGPTAVLAERNHCIKAFDKIVSRHRLEPLRTMGDVYFAVGGGPMPNPGHPGEAVRCAAEIRRFAVGRGAERNADGLAVLSFRLAIHTGSVIGGLVDAQKVSFDLFGDTVTETLEMLRLAGHGQAVVSETTLSRLAEPVPVLEAGTVKTRTETDFGVYTLSDEVETESGA